jgi:hypothetical protein
MFILHHVHHLDQNPGVLVFNLCICHTGDSAKLSVLQMLELSFLGCKTGSKAWYRHRELAPALKRRYIYRYIGMVGGKASNRTNYIKNTKTVMGGEEGEGERTNRSQI